MGLIRNLFVGDVELRELDMIGSLERPSTDLIEALSAGGRSTAGVSVNEENAVRMLAVFAALRVVSEGVGLLPMHLYQRLQPRGRRRLGEDEDPRVRLLEDEPNPLQSASDFWTMLTGHANSWGNGYGLKVLDRGTGRVREVWPLRPDRTRPLRLDGRSEVGRGRPLVYVTWLDDGERVVLLPDEVIHVKGFGHGDVGISTIGAARQAIGLAVAAEEYAGHFWSQGARPGGVITVPIEVKDDELKKAVRRWNRAHQGLDRSHLVSILDKGASWHDVGIPQGDAQFIETRQFQIREIARAFRVPPHMIADLEGTVTFKSIEQQSIDFVRFSLGIWLRRIEQAFKRGMFGSELDRAARLFPKFNANALLRGDYLTRWRGYEIGLRNKVLTPNDVRDEEEMELVEWGDEPIAMPGELPPEEPELDAGGGDDDEE